MKKKKTTLNRLFLTVIFVAVSALLGLIKIPSPVGSVAMDSAPGYFMAVFTHPVLGGIVGALGHIASAATAGFPLKLLHIAVALQMFLWCFVFGFMILRINRKWAFIPSAVLTVFLNVMVGPYSLYLLGFMDKGDANGLMIPLTIASIANITLATVALLLTKSLKKK